MENLAWVPLMEGSTHANKCLRGVEHGWPQTERVFGHVIPKSIPGLMGRLLGIDQRAARGRNC